MQHKDQADTVTILPEPLGNFRFWPPASAVLSKGALEALREVSAYYFKATRRHACSGVLIVLQVHGGGMC